MKLKRELKYTAAAEGIYEIETYYLGRTNFTCCYVMVDDGQAAVIETNTNQAVPYILATIDELGIERSRVQYVIITHVHLDHAGGSGELLKYLPQAKLVLHPRGQRHMQAPEKLIESVKQVYGEERYAEYYGDVAAVPQERLQTAADGEVIRFGNREMLIVHTPGHAKHHLIVFDKKTRSLFSGDAFGIGYTRYNPEKPGLVFPSTSPTQFDPGATLQTLQRMEELDPLRVMRTHYGAVTNVRGNLRHLREWVAFAVDIAEKRYQQGLRDKALSEALEQDIWDRYEIFLKNELAMELTAEERDFLFIDASLNAQGLAHYVTQRFSAS